MLCHVDCRHILVNDAAVHDGLGGIAAVFAISSWDWGASFGSPTTGVLARKYGKFSNTSGNGGRFSAAPPLYDRLYGGKTKAEDTEGLALLGDAAAASK